MSIHRAVRVVTPFSLTTAMAVVWLVAAVTVVDETVSATPGENAGLNATPLRLSDRNDATLLSLTITASV